LQLTQSAAMMLADVRREDRIPTSYGVRLSGQLTVEGDLGLTIAFAAGPAPTDTVDEQHGTKLFLAEEVAETLSDIALDVTMSVAGNGASPVSLVFRPQPRGDER
jgi:hypothetical protein